MAAIAAGPAREKISASQKRIPALDGVRALASLMVVAYHFGPHIVRTADSRFQFLLRLPRQGREGVDLFFVLSGFLISGILVEARSSPRYFRTFYLRRIFRIFPLYYLVLAAYTLTLFFLGAQAASFGALFENHIPTWAYWIYGQNFAMAWFASFGPLWMAGSWSLAVEEQFYFILPLTIKRVSDASLMRLAVAAGGFSLCLRAILQFKRHDVAGFVLIFSRLDALAAGIIVMLLVRNHSEALRRNLRSVRWLAGAAGIAWLLFPALPSAISIRMAFLSESISAIAFGLFILNVLLAPGARISRVLSLQPVRLLGNMAYSTYLFHPILLCLAFRAMRGADPRLNTAADLPPLAVALAATLILSYVSWTRFERPVVNLGHRYQY